MPLSDQRRLVTLEELLAKGLVALSFRGGHGCPYCRINTNALAHAQCDIEPFGRQIVAIRGLQHFATALTANAAATPFPILTDDDNGYGLSFNLAIFDGLEMQKLMTSADWDVAPITATTHGYCLSQRHLPLAPISSSVPASSIGSVSECLSLKSGGIAWQTKT